MKVRYNFRKPMIPLFTGLILIVAPPTGAARRRHPRPVRRTTPRRTTGGRVRRSGCRPAAQGAARPPRHADGGGPGSAEPRCPPPCSPRIRRERAQLRRRPPGRPGATDGPPRRADRPADRSGRRGGSRRTGATGSTRATRGGHRRGRRSGREALATLATAGGDDGATRTGAHPKTEAVLLVPATVVRLERPLAHWNDSGYSRSRMSTNPLVDLPLVQSCTPLKNQGGPAGSAARNGRLNTDRSTVRGRLWTGQTGHPQGFPQACGQNSRRTTGQPVVTDGSLIMITL